MKIDERFMRMAMALAKKAEGMTSPNPIVGAVLVKNGRVIARGYHKKAGLPHAEADALNRAGRAAKGATLYVTLEPCDHLGRTGPCTDAIMRSGVKRVVIGMKDPNPKNNGNGAARLKRGGLAVGWSGLSEECELMNRPYVKFITGGLPYVTVKVAQTLDGKIATRSGDSRWITSADSRAYVHRLRSKADAVMVGINTVVKDDPLLLADIPGARQPVRIIVDSNLRSPIGSRIFRNVDRSRLLIATGPKATRRKIELCENAGARILMPGLKNGRIDLRRLLKLLAKMGIMHILVEGGGELVAGLIEARLADNFLFFIAPKIAGGRDAKTSVEGDGVEKIKDAIILKDMRLRKFKNDILIEVPIGRYSK